MIWAVKLQVQELVGEKKLCTISKYIFSIKWDEYLVVHKS